jgi:hypothetical protein
MPMKVVSNFQSGRLGDVVYVNGRYGLHARRHVIPRNPRTPAQQRIRSNFGAVSSRWRGLTPEQRAAWSLAAAGTCARSSNGRKVPLSGYSFFVSVDTKRANLNLPQFNLPPAEPSFNPNPVGELAVTNTAGKVALKLRVLVQPTPYTLVSAAAPVSAGVRCASHFACIGLLPAPVNGWSDITDLYVAQYGAPPPGMAVFVRSQQHIDGWTDIPRLTGALVPSPSP